MDDVTVTIVFTILLLPCLYIAVMLHELSHAAFYLAFGVRPKEITFGSGKKCLERNLNNIVFRFCCNPAGGKCEPSAYFIRPFYLFGVLLAGIAANIVTAFLFYKIQLTVNQPLLKTLLWGFIAANGSMAAFDAIPVSNMNDGSRCIQLVRAVRSGNNLGMFYERAENAPTRYNILGFLVSSILMAKLFDTAVFNLTGGSFYMFFRK
ncbi:MAG: site-2 protease family protein [Firmicutes bacterium]|nr:site-2 protease family protein [Bacillota bacterium]